MKGLEASFEDSADRLQRMNARVDHLLDEALALWPDERSALVVALLDSLDGEDKSSVQVPLRPCLGRKPVPA